MNDSLKIKDINEAFEKVQNLISSGHLDEAKKLANKSYVSSIKINYAEGVSLFYTKMITIYMVNSEHRKAVPYIQNLIKISKKEKNTIKLGNLYFRLGTILTNLKNYKSAHYYLKKSLDISTKLKNVDYSIIIFSYISLSSNFLMQKKIQRALKYINIGINIIKDKDSEKVNLRSLNVFKTKILLKLDSNEAQKLFDKIKHIKSRNKHEDLEMNNIEMHLLSKKPIHDSKEFIQKINSTIKKNIEISNTKGIINLLQILKKHYFDNNQIEMAYKYANQIIDIETENNNKQVSVADINEKSIENFDNIEEEFEIYYKSELEIAARYQQNCYLNKIKSPKLRIQTLFKPSNTLSGDYIGTFDLGNNKFLMILGDVVGKGITASYISFLLDGIINTIIKTTKTFCLEKNIYHINSVISNSLKNKGFVSLWAGIIDTTNNELQSINAGHMPIYVIQQDNLVELNEGSTILGMFEKLPNVDIETINFLPSDILIAYSDGVTESVNNKSEDYQNNFKLLIENYSKTRNFNFIKKLESDLEEFQDSSLIQDDISCLFVEYK